MAQAPPAPSPPPEEAPPSEATHQQWYDSLGWSVTVGGGVEDFTGDTMRRTTGTGGSWNVRITGGTHSYIGFEASYIGSAQSINALGLTTDSTLVGNGVQGAVRINGTIHSPVQPFGYGGAAYRNYSLSTNGVNTSDIATHDNVLEVPLGVGLGVYLMDGSLAIDVRGEYRFAWGQRVLVPETNGTSALLDRWGVMGNIGYAF